MPSGWNADFILIRSLRAFALSQPFKKFYMAEQKGQKGQNGVSPVGG
jgi:hypothetical protein